MAEYRDSVSTQADGAVALQHLVKSFRGAGGPVRAVRGIDVSIERGETVAMLEPNGAGKSTTPDMLLGVRRARRRHRLSLRQYPSPCRRRR